MVFVFFVFIYIFSTYQIQFTLITSGNIMNGTKLISWCCKIIEIEENHMHSGINQRNFEKEILNLNCDKWTNVDESMWKGSRRLKWRLPLSAFHKAWLLTILSADLILFNLFVSLCSLSLALFWWNIKMKISFFCLSLLHLSLHLSPHLPLVFIFFSLSLSFSLLS